MPGIELPDHRLGVVGNQVAPEQPVVAVVLRLGPVALKFAALEVEQDVELRAGRFPAEDSNHADRHDVHPLVRIRIRPARDDERRQRRFDRGDGVDTRREGLGDEDRPFVKLEVGGGRGKGCALRRLRGDGGSDRCAQDC